MTRLLMDVDTALGFRGGDIDDAHAIALLAGAARLPHTPGQSGPWQLLGVTTTCGNVTLAAAAPSTRLVCELLDLHVPVVEGAAAPLEDRPLRTGHSIVMKSEGSGEEWVFDRAAPAAVAAPPAWDFMAQALDEAPATLLATGPLCNVARLLREHPRSAQRIERIVCMGGWFEGAQAAEFNMSVDPLAAEIVFGSGIPTVIVPLEMTLQTVLKRGEIADWPGLGEAGRVFHVGTLDWLDQVEPLRGQEGCNLHDPLAAAYLLWPGLFQTAGIVPAIDRTTGFTRVVERSEASPVRVVTGFDLPAFYRHYHAAMRASFQAPPRGQ